MHWWQVEGHVVLPFSHQRIAHFRLYTRFQNKRGIFKATSFCSTKFTSEVRGGLFNSLNGTFLFKQWTQVQWTQLKRTNFFINLFILEYN